MIRCGVVSLLERWPPRPKEAKNDMVKVHPRIGTESRTGIANNDVWDGLEVVGAGVGLSFFVESCSKRAKSLEDGRLAVLVVLEIA